MNFSTLINDLVGLFNAIVNDVIGTILSFVVNNWAIILLVVLVVLAPYAAPWLTSLGAPAWLVTTFVTVGTATSAALAAAADYIAGVAVAAFSSFELAGLGTQLFVVFGIAALLEPAKTAAVLQAALALTTGALGTVVGAVAGGLSGLLIPLGLAAVAFFMLSSNGNDSANSTKVGGVA